MPSNQNSITIDAKNLKENLGKIFKVILKKIETDASFAEEICDALTLGKDAKQQNDLDFNATEYLLDNGEESLKRELELFTDQRLQSLALSERIFTSKQLNTKQREEIIIKIISFAVRNLKKGSSFSRVGEKDD